jgi:hypothetical protein
VNYRTPHEEFMVREVMAEFRRNGRALPWSYVGSVPLLATEWYRISPDAADRLDEGFLREALAYGNVGTLDLMTRVLGAITAWVGDGCVIGLTVGGRWRVHVPGQPTPAVAHAKHIQSMTAGMRDRPMLLRTGAAQCVMHDDCAEEPKLGEACWLSRRELRR